MRMTVKLIDFLYSIYWRLLEVEYEYIDRLAYASAAKKLIDKTEDLEDFDDILLDIVTLNRLLEGNNEEYKIVLTDEKTEGILKELKVESLIELENLNQSEKDYIVRQKQLNDMIGLIDTVLKYN